MEYRYYITFAIVVIILQGLVYTFSRTQAWLFNFGKTARRVNLVLNYLVINGLILLHFTTQITLFRPLALLLVILWFALLSRLATQLLSWLAKRWIEPQRLNRYLKGGYCILFIALIGTSVYNAYVPNIVHYDIELDKPIAPMKIGVASDLYLGKLVGRCQLDKLATIFEREKVDLILLPGDIMDDNVEAYLAENMQPSLKKLNAPLGVYATLGNHDFFGHQAAIAEQIRQAGIHLLADQAVVLPQKFAIIGRNDDLVANRPTAAELLANLDPTLPILLLDHRPSEIEQHAKLPIDLQVSGHTHRGQIFPANLITALLYPLDYGYQKIGQGHYVVTSGYGFWGIPMRLGSQAEVVIIHLKGRSLTAQ
ncbi:metallophosphoesterase [Muribacter muris]|uniref:Metallophosphoesterase n=1 Tax=Muribacter muris TaxID=67855 RepID=A0A4Y9K7D4_9PAST|nr:metallophosphoesterase [Muribacter muris]MBF0784019.1 metallophosphoesterase [Muribacter muris]MBF0827432.1 metallophosphoesterase [Muribacter muris]TFV13412.1 metallophosphoesterase [Muribacter muris]